MTFCQGPRCIGKETLERVYLYLKDKVHNKEPLEEAHVRETIFGPQGVDEDAGAELVPKVLELILIEEDELLLKNLIKGIFSGAVVEAPEEADLAIGRLDDASLSRALASTADRGAGGDEWRSREPPVVVFRDAVFAEDSKEAARPGDDAKGAGDVDDKRAPDAAAAAGCTARPRAGTGRRRGSSSRAQDGVHDGVHGHNGAVAMAARDAGEERALDASLAALVERAEGDLRDLLEASRLARQRSRATLRERLQRRWSDRRGALRDNGAGEDALALERDAATAREREAVARLDGTLGARRRRPRASSAVDAALRRRLDARSALAARLEKRASERRADAGGGAAGDAAAAEVVADLVAAHDATSRERGGARGRARRRARTCSGGATRAATRQDPDGDLDDVGVSEELADWAAADAEGARSELAAFDASQASLYGAQASLRGQVLLDRADPTKQLSAVDAASAGVREGLRLAAEDLDLPAKADDGALRSRAAALIGEHAAEQEAKEHAFAEERSRQHAALRSRLKARCVPAAPGVGPRSDEAVDEELAEWAELEGDLARRELKATRDAHAKFCGEAFGICEAARGNQTFHPTSIYELVILNCEAAGHRADMATVTALVRDHDGALGVLAGDLAKAHARKRADLVARLRDKHAQREAALKARLEAAAESEREREAKGEAAPPSPRGRLRELAEEVEATLAALDAELESERRREMLLVAAEVAPAPEAKADDAEYHRLFVDLADAEAAAAEKRLERQRSDARRQRDAIERRLERRRSTSKPKEPEAKPLPVSTTTQMLARQKFVAPKKPLPDIVAQIEQARDANSLAHQLHTKRQYRHLHVKPAAPAPLRAPPTRDAADLARAPARTSVRQGGLRTEVDPGKARYYYWFERAAAKGEEQAIENLALLDARV
ncbi:hypothetical protein JL722_369 [Aureococcus anophagefferens]|nr:hypothetical protein JL722_369 [Aureococcus anophagefferens]